MDEPIRVPLWNRAGEIVGRALIDADDAEMVLPLRWYPSNGYASTHIRDGGRWRHVLLHRVVLGLTPFGPLVDHRDRDKLNCRKANLRVGGRAMNAQNKPSYRGASSVHRGVSWYKANRKWGVNVQVNGKQHFLGLFTDEEEAAEVARTWRLANMPFTVE